MRTGFSRLTGVVIFIGAIVGLALSIYGVYGLWASKQQVSTALIDLVDLSARTVTATTTMLEVVSDSLEQASADMALIEAILDNTANTIGESNTLVDTTAVLMGEDMPEFLANTQTSLTSVQTTARVIDDVLGAITRVPLLGSFLTRRYAPEVPLADSVADVKESLEPLPDTFIAIQQDMEEASASLDTVQGEIAALSQQIAEIDASIERATTVVEDYKLILEDFQTRVMPLQERLPALIDTTYLGLTIVLVWIFISQLGALLHAIELLR